MSKKKQSLSAVPAWFDIQKYTGVADFDILEWFFHINFRLMFSSIFDENSRERLRENMERAGYQLAGDDLRYYRAMLDGMLAQPIGKHREKRARSAVLGNGTVKKHLVSDLSAMMVMSAAEELHKEEAYVNAWEAFNWSMTTAEEWILKRLEGKWNALEGSVSDFMNEKFPASGNFVYAEVDIHAPFDDLVESFKQWVTEKKKERGIPFGDKKTFSDLDFKRWHRYAVLPYFDLKIWAKAEGVHIPDWLYVEALFGGMQGDTDGMFRKNTKPLERRVMTQGCADQLRNQGDIHY